MCDLLTILFQPALQEFMLYNYKLYVEYVNHACSIFQSTFIPCQWLFFPVIDTDAHLKSVKAFVVSPSLHCKNLRIFHHLLGAPVINCLMHQAFLQAFSLCLPWHENSHFALHSKRFSVSFAEYSKIMSIL